MSDEFIKQKVHEHYKRCAMARLKEKADTFNELVVPLISIRFKTKPEPISKKKLRLYRDVILHNYPLYRFVGDYELARAISEVFKVECTEEHLQSLASFKKITKKEVITLQDDNVKTIKVIRWRDRDRLHRNIIHFPT